MELTIDEFAERAGCSVAQVAYMRRKGRVKESSRNRFYASDVGRAAECAARLLPLSPRVLSEAVAYGQLPQDDDGVRGLAAIPDPRAVCRTVNTLSDRHVLTARERAFESVGLAF